MPEIILRVHLSDELWQDLHALAEEMNTDEYRLASFLMTVRARHHLRENLRIMRGEGKVDT